MNHHILGASVAAVLVFPVASPVWAQAGSQSTSATCSAVVGGARFPELLPAYFVWENFWDSVVSAQGDTRKIQELLGDLAADGGTVAVVTNAASKAKATAATSRAATVPPGGSRALAQQREAIAAEAILEGRDELIRSLPKDVFDRVRALVHARRGTLIYSLGDVGHWTQPDPTGQPRCQATIDGRLAPHLIPESYTWEVFFRFRAADALESRTKSGGFAREFLIALQEQRYPIPLDQLQLVLNFAIAVNDDVDRIYASHMDPEALRLAVADVVLDARSRLMRQLPARSWIAVQHNAEALARSTIFDFPPSTY